MTMMVTTLMCDDNDAYNDNDTDDENDTDDG